MAVSVRFTVTTAEKLDPRYCIKVYLIRNDRPKYWTFRCIQCGKPVAELDGQIGYLADVVDNTSAVAHAGLRFKCQGPYCRLWYDFTLN